MTGLSDSVSDATHGLMGFVYTEPEEQTLFSDIQ